MSSPVIWGGNSTSIDLQPNLQLTSAGATILSGTTDPTSVAVSANKSSIYHNTSNGFVYIKQDNGSTTNWVQVFQGVLSPNVSTFTSGSGTYTTPSNTLYISVKMIGGGGGGGGAGTSNTGGTGGNGGNSTFGSWTAGLGSGGSGATGVNGGAGGTNTASSGSVIVNAAGATGNGGTASGASSLNIVGGDGGVSPLGGGGPGDYQAGGAAITNSGSGGGGAGSQALNNSAGGGGAGGYLEFIIISPSATYSYGVGAGGSAGTAGTGGFAGGAGGSGYIAITAYQIVNATTALTPIPTNNFAQGYFTGATWSTTSTSLVDPTVSGTNAYTSRQSNGLSISVAASNKPGITFTPANNSAIYFISVNVCLSIASSAIGSIVLTDSTTIIAQGVGVQGNAANSHNITLTGIYVPGTASAVTIKLQLAAQSGNTLTLTQVNQVSPNIVAEWTLMQIK